MPSGSNRRSANPPRALRLRAEGFPSEFASGSEDLVPPARFLVSD
jgi:hypothetical protein